jgi:hypothetical protein
VRVGTSSRKSKAPRAFYSKYTRALTFENLWCAFFNCRWSFNCRCPFNCRWQNGRCMTSSFRAASILKSPLCIEFDKTKKQTKVHYIGGRSVGINSQKSSIYHNVPHVSYVPQVHCIGVAEQLASILKSPPRSEFYSTVGVKETYYRSTRDLLQE